MCGIVGIVNSDNVRKKAEKSLDRIIYRGLDDKGFYYENKLCFGHCLHSVVGNTKQPIIKDNFVFGANCEIYNWKELTKKYKFKSKNDAELLLDILIYYLKNKRFKEINGKLLNKILNELDGVFAFFIYSKKYKYTLIARDVLGEKPVWFSSKDKTLFFASEKKAIEEIELEELNPRKIILFNNKNVFKFFNQNFFGLSNNKEINLIEAKEKIKKLLDKAIQKRIPNKNLGLLFSGGLDSTLLAFILKNKNIKFTAYMTVSEKKKDEIENAQKIAKKLDFKLKLVKINKNLVLKELPKIINLIESADPVKVEIGMTIFFALKEAKKDKIKVIFSGIGADDIFCGYKRMFMYHGINEDSLSNLRRIYEKDLYRDDVLSMANNIELRLPYLDKQLVKFMLTIPSKYKYTKTPKLILKEIAEEIGLSKRFTTFKRNAAQYSSGMNKIISEIIKDKKTYKGKFFSKLYGKRNLKLGVLFSSGKDSTYAMYIQNRLNYEITCLISIESKNKDSFMFHTPAIKLAKHQAEVLSIPMVIQKTKGKKEKELTDLKKAIIEAKEYGIQGIVTGALYSNYQRIRIEKICDELNLKVYSPLWHTSQEKHMKNLIKENFEVIITAVAAEGLDKSWLGRKINQKIIDELVRLNKKLGINVAGEGGEFETFVLDCPMFKKKLKIVSSKVIEDSENCAKLVINKIKLENKL
ncbi:ATP-binding protein [archaeon]|nr:ATP-binding protein [archaeon]|tara:strand:+ start:482 stop:2569 length:2088 start_codon:yes stop_codon:yes gene_type:complete